MSDAIGWVATALFASSYFFTRPVSLRAVQALAAVLWVGYGVSIGAMPVVVANMIIVAAAAWSVRRQQRRQAPS